MHDARERVHFVAREQDVELDQVAFAVADDVVVERRVALRAALQRVEVVHDQLGQRHLEDELDGGRGEVLHVLEGAAPVHGQLHDRAHEIRRHDDLRLQVGLLDALDGSGVGHVLRAVHDHHVAVGQVDLVFHRRRRGDQVQRELAL